LRSPKGDATTEREDVLSPCRGRHSLPQEMAQPRRFPRGLPGIRIPQAFVDNFWTRWKRKASVKICFALCYRKFDDSNKLSVSCRFFPFPALRLRPSIRLWRAQDKPVAFVPVGMAPGTGFPFREQSRRRLWRPPRTCSPYGLKCLRCKMLRRYHGSEFLCGTCRFVPKLSETFRFFPLRSASFRHLLAESVGRRYHVGRMHGISCGQQRREAPMSFPGGKGS